MKRRAWVAAAAVGSDALSAPVALASSVCPAVRNVRLRVSRVRQAMHARGGRTKQRRGATSRAHHAEDADGKDGDGTDAGSQEPSCSREAKETERRRVSRRVAQGAQPPPYLWR